MARILTVAPWVSFSLLAFPAPLLFLVLLILSTTTESAALYLFLSVLSGVVGVMAGLVIVVLLVLYRRRWLTDLRDRLAENGITAREIDWFLAELTSEERKALAELKKQNPLLADAYKETLAGRLMATRIKRRAERELVRVRRRLNQAKYLKGTDTSALLSELHADRQRLEQVNQEAQSRLAKAKAQLQSIEASASRESNRAEIELMMNQLSFTQEYLPLLMEMSQLEAGLDRKHEASEENSRHKD